MATTFNSVEMQSLRSLFGPEKAETVREVLERHFDAHATKTAANRRLAFMKLTRWAVEQGPSSALALPISADGWEALVHAWADAWRARTDVSATTVAENINDLWRCIEALAAKAVVPRIVRPRMPPNYHRAAGKRKSLAEVSEHQELDSAWRLLRDTLEPNADEDSDADGFLRTLSDNDDVRALTSTDAIFSAIERLNSERLSRVRELAEASFIHWSDVFDEGQKLATAETSRDLDLLIAGDIKLVSNVAVRDHFFPKGRPELAQANFVRLVNERYDGLCPGETTFGDPSAFRAVAIRLGGKQHFEGWFGAKTEAVVAAAMMYLVDTGANVSVALSLTPEFEMACDEPGHVQIRGVKARAGYKPIVDRLPVHDPSVKLSTVAALRKLKAMTQVYRERGRGFSDALFVHRWGGRILPASSDLFANGLTYLLRKDPVLSRVPLRPSYIRSSFLLQAALSKDGDVRIAAALGNHAPGGGTTEGYTQRYPTRLLYLKKIREFQDVLQVSVIFDIPGACSSFGIHSGQAAALLDKAMRTGLGVSCRNPLEGVQPGTRPGEMCSKIDRCTGCRNVLVHVTPENLADMILLRERLKVAEPEWQATRTSRWEEAWLPYLALCEVVIEKVSRSAHARLITAAEELAKQARIAGRFSLPLF